MSPIQKMLVVILLAFFAYGDGLWPTMAKEHPKTDSHKPLEKSDGLGLSLVPIPASRARFILLNFGFSPSTAILAAKTGCIFNIEIGNDNAESDSPMVHVDTTLWRVRYDEGWKPMGQESWLSRLEALENDPSPVIVLRWRLLPTEVRFGPQDYFNGLVAFDLPQAQLFDLEVNWNYGLSGQSVTIPGLQCPDSDLPYPGPTVRLHSRNF